MNNIIIPLRGRIKKRLNNKLIKYQGKIYKYRDNNLIYIQPDNKTTYYDYTYGKKTNKFYPITPARYIKIQKYKSVNKEQEDFFKFVNELKKFPELTTIRNGLHFDEKEQKLLLNIPNSRKAVRLTVENSHYQDDYLSSKPEFRQKIINDLTDVYVKNNYKKVFIDTKTYLTYKNPDGISFTTVKDLRRGEEGFQRLLISKEDIPRFVDDYFNMIELYCINSEFARHDKNAQSIYSFENIAKTEFIIVKLKSKYGGCNISIQPWLKFTASNIHYLDNREDNKCFFWSLIAALNRHFDRFYVRRITFIDYYLKYYKSNTPYFNGYTLQEIDQFINNYPVDIDNFSLFKELEDKLNIRLQIIYCDGTQDQYESSYIHYVGSSDDLRPLIQLMYYTDITQSHEGHFMPIVSEKNLRNLLNNGRRWICTHCKKSFKTKVGWSQHEEKCLDNLNKKYRLQPYQTFIRYHDYNKEMDCLVFGAADYETSFQRTDKYNTEENGIHAQLLPLLLKCYIKSNLRNLPNFNPDIYTADDPEFELNFLDELYEYGQRYLKEVQLNIDKALTPENLEKFRKDNQCYICGHKFGQDCEFLDEFDTRLLNASKKERSNFDIKCFDHNHQTGEYRGALCSRCNLQVSYKYLSIPIFFHNYSNFDCIFLRNAINRWNTKRIKQGLEPCFYKPLGISIDSDLFGKWGPFVFQDSCKLMPESLETLVENLNRGANSFPCTEEYAKTISEKTGKPLKDIMNVLTHKQIFPYSLITSMFSFKAKNNKLIGIPKKSLCKDYLNEKEYTQEEYNSLVNAAKTLGLHSLLDIYKNYLECDVRLLIDVLDNFNKTMVESYTIGKVKGNSPLWFYTISAYTRSMSLKYAEAIRNDIIKPNFLFNRLNWSDEKIKAADECINRFKHSNGIRLLNNGEEELYNFINNSINGGISYSLNKYANVNDGVHIEGYDCSSMYARCLCEWLPFDIRFTNKFSSVALVEEHLKKCHDYDYLQYMFEVDIDVNKKLTQFPCIPNKEPTLSGDVKLNLTLRDKQKVIIQQNVLKLYVELGCKITNVYRVVEMTCSPFYYPFIHKSLELRSQAKSTFESNLYKLVCNSLFGSSLLNSANYATIKYLTNEKQIEKVFNKVYQIQNVELNDIDGSLRVSISQSKICQTPRYIGSIVLHYSKYLLYNFWYNYIVKVFKEPKLNFIETDSIYFNHLGKIRNDLDKEFIGKTPGLFKVEHRDITELITLRSKMYCYKTPNSITKKAKGIKKNYIDNNVKFEDYKEILESTEDLIKTASYNLIQKDSSSVYINRVSKKLFSKENNMIDDKVVFIDKYTSVPIS